VPLRRDFDADERCIEHVSSAAMTPVEPAGVTPVQSPDGGREHLVRERPDEVVMRGHEAELVTFEEVRTNEFRQDRNASLVVLGILEDPFFGDRTRRDVERACMSWTHLATLPGRRVCDRNEFANS